LSERNVVLTSDGLKKIEDELRTLQTVRRQEVAELIRQAKDLGDVSENTEYETAKNEQAFLEGRITDLKSILMSATIIDPTDVPTDCVGIGSVVKVKDLDYGDEWEFRMVGSYEADPDNDRISNESPIGESLMDRKVGEVVEATTPGGKIRYEIVSIRRQGE
jgi:transcription elongation factor GreA